MGVSDQIQEADHLTKAYDKLKGTQEIQLRKFALIMVLHSIY